MVNNVVAYQTSSIGKKVRVVNTNGLDYTSDNINDILGAISQSQSPTLLNVVWDTAEFWKPIFKLLSPSVVSDLADGKAGNIPGARLWWGITRHGRVIGIRTNFRTHLHDNFYSESRNEIEISELKQYYDTLDAQDLAHTAELGAQLVATLKNMGLSPTSLISAISIYKECWLDKIPLPVMLNMADDLVDAHELAFNAVDEWVATYKSMPDNSKVYSYDLTNAYGAALAVLPDLRYGDIIYSKEIPAGCYWGVMDAKIHNKTMISPLNRPDLGKPYVGYWNGVIATDLLSSLIQWDIADFEIHGGWFLMLRKYCKPLEYSMKRLYSLRNGDTLQNNLAKAMSVATWGKMLETRTTKDGVEYGDLFNAIYGSMVVNHIKTKVTDFIYGNGLQDYLVEVKVDGVKALKDLDITTERQFGEWRKGG